MSPRSLRIVHSIPHYLPEVRTGGVVPFVRDLARTQRSMGHDVQIVTTCKRSRDGGGSTVIEIDSTRVSRYQRITSVGHGISLTLWRDAPELVANADVLHVHGLFSAANATLIGSARRANTPVVLSPHGSCMTSAIAFGRYRKLAFLYLVGRKQFKNALVHVTSESERSAVRKWAPAARIVTVPPGAPTIPPVSVPDRDQNQVLYLGRYHPIKGFDMLLDAMSRVRAILPQAELVVAGPSLTQQRAIWKQASRLNPTPQLRFVGFVDGDDKWRLLASVSGLVLTSHSESFGLVVVEALGSGTPVVTTERSPWPELETRRAGRWVKHDAKSVADAIVELLRERDPRQIAHRAARAREMAATYSWRTAAESFEVQYRRIMRADRSVH